MLVKDVVGYEGLYTIDEYGNVFGIKNNHYLAKCHDKDGYILYHLYKNGKGKTARAHIEVAKAFIINDDPINKTTVDHIDANKENNHYSNLRWLSISENTAIANKRRDYSNWFVRVKATRISDGKVFYFNSIKECCENIKGLTYTDVNCCKNGKQKTAKGYKFECLDECFLKRKITLDKKKSM